jgi:hypothetical protein
MASIGRPAMSASSTSDRISSCCPSSPMAIGARLKALSRPIDLLAEDAHTESSLCQVVLFELGLGASRWARVGDSSGRV